MLNSWDIQITQDTLMARRDNRKYTCYASIRFAGPLFYKESKEENAVYVDRVVFVPEGVTFVPKGETIKSNIINVDGGDTYEQLF